jgi:C4-dicarboxylate transporter, DctM subunit
MSPLTLGSLGLGAVIVLLLVRVPIGVTLGGVAVIGIWLLVGAKSALGIVAAIPYEFAAHWSLSSIPMFLLMGYACYHARLTEGLFRAARVWLGGLPGGLGVASIWGAAMFSAVTGSSVACAAAMGRIAVPEMLKYKYSGPLAAGVVAAAGTMGSLIPPSVIFLIYGIFAEVPISKLFMAGVLPGVLSAVNYSLMTIAIVAAKPHLAPRAPAARFSEKLAVAWETWPVLALAASVLGGLFGGVFTPTEAGAVGALLAFLVAAAKRTLSWHGTLEATRETLSATASIFIIAVGAALLTRFLALTGLPEEMAAAAAVFHDNPLVLVIGVSVLYLILGCFLDPIGIMLLTLPVLLPVFEAVKIDLIWMGVILTKYLEIGLLTPPVGLNVFVLKTVVGDRMSLESIFRGVALFIATDLVTVSLLIAFPSISLYLPGLLE